MKNNRNILVSGGAGFIGSHLVANLLDRGYSVAVLDNLSTGKKDNLKGFMSHPNFKFLLGDILNPKEVRQSLEGVDAVMHLAALIDVSASVTNPILTHKINVTGTLNLLQEAINHKIGKFVFASSTAVYGDTKTLPVREEASIQPISPYAASKAAAEAYCCAYAQCYGLDTVRLRFFNVYGPRNQNSPYSGVITKFLNKANSSEPLTIEGDGEQTRDFIYVSDIVRALVLALERQNLRGEVFNVCTGKPISINVLARTIGIVTGKKLEINHVAPRLGDIRFSYGDSSKAASRLGFKAKTDLNKGIRLLLESK